MKQEDYDKALRKYPLANMSGKAIAIAGKKLTQLKK